MFPGIGPNWLAALFFCFSSLFVVLNLYYNRFNLYKARWIGGTLIGLTLFSLGWLSVIRYNELNNKDHFSKVPAQFLVIQINNEPILKNGLLRFTAAAEQSVNNGKKSVVSGTLLITIKDSIAKTLQYGDELLVPSKYNPVEPRAHVPAEFNYKKYLAGQNVLYQAYLYPKQYVRLASNTGNAMIAYSLQLRQRCIEKFKLNMRDTNAIAVASTLILGYNGQLKRRCFAGLFQNRDYPRTVRFRCSCRYYFCAAKPCTRIFKQPPVWQTAEGRNHHHTHLVLFIALRVFSCRVPGRQL